MDGVVFLYTTWPDAETAQACAQALIQARLAACANILAPMQSTYVWQGRIETAAEIPVLFKTTQACSAAARDLIVARHPYETPCVAALSVETSASHQPFLAWIADQTGPAGIADSLPG